MPCAIISQIFLQKVLKNKCTIPINNIIFLYKKTFIILSTLVPPKGFENKIRIIFREISLFVKKVNLASI